MSLSDDTAGLLLVVMLVALVGLAVVVTVIGLRLAKLRRDYSAALDRSRREDLFAAVASQRDEIGVLRKDIALVNENTETLRQLLRASVSRVGVVRYDAFEDMGGLLSFSAALLDEHGDGVVISTINGRSEARTYAKAVQGGASTHTLSHEEIDAIDDAMAMTGRSASGPADRRPRRRKRATT